MPLNWYERLISASLLGGFFVFVALTFGHVFKNRWDDMEEKSITVIGCEERGSVRVWNSTCPVTASLASLIIQEDIARHIREMEIDLSELPLYKKIGSYHASEIILPKRNCRSLVILQGLSSASPICSRFDFPKDAPVSELFRAVEAVYGVDVVKKILKKRKSIRVAECILLDVDC